MGARVTRGTLQLTTGTHTASGVQTGGVYEVVRDWADTPTSWNTRQPGQGWFAPGLSFGDVDAGDPTAPVTVDADGGRPWRRCRWTR